MLRFGFLSRGSNLPRAGLLFDIPNRYPFVDRVGKHDGQPQLMQYASVASGTVTLYHASIVGTETISSHGGTAAVGVVAGGITIGIGTAWEVRDSAGHIWSHCAALSATSVVMWDVGKGDHLVATGLAEAVVTALCSTGRDPLVGTDRLNQRGVTVADGNQYLSAKTGGKIPSGLIIPGLESGSGCCAFVVGG